MRQVVATRWQLTAQPLLVDYVDRLAEEITVDGHPSVERARALAQRLPVTVRIEGPVIRWASHPQDPQHDWWREGDGTWEDSPPSDALMPGADRHDERGMGHRGAHVGEGRGWGDEPPGWQQIRQITARSTPAGHRLVVGAQLGGRRLEFRATAWRGHWWVFARHNPDAEPIPTRD